MSAKVHFPSMASSEALIAPPAASRDRVKRCGDFDEILSKCSFVCAKRISSSVAISGSTKV